MLLNDADASTTTPMMMTTTAHKLLMKTPNIDHVHSSCSVLNAHCTFRMCRHINNFQFLITNEQKVADRKRVSFENHSKRMQIYLCCCFQFDEKEKKTFAHTYVIHCTVLDYECDTFFLFVSFSFLASRKILFYTGYVINSSVFVCLNGILITKPFSAHAVSAQLSEFDIFWYQKERKKRFCLHTFVSFCASISLSSSFTWSSSCYNVMDNTLHYFRTFIAFTKCAEIELMSFWYRHRMHTQYTHITYSMKFFVCRNNTK